MRSLLDQPFVARSLNVVERRVNTDAMRRLSNLRFIQQQHNNTNCWSAPRRKLLSTTTTTTNIPPKKVVSTYKNNRSRQVYPPGAREPPVASSTTAEPFAKKTVAMGPYGIKRIDYSKSIPPKWPRPIAPPPSSKNPLVNYFPHLTIGVGVCFAIFIFFNADQEGMSEYWDAVDRGDVPVGDGGDDDEDFDEDQDEWADPKPTDGSVPK